MQGPTDNAKASDPVGSSQQVLYRYEITDQARVTVHLNCNVFLVVILFHEEVRPCLTKYWTIGMNIPVVHSALPNELFPIAILVSSRLAYFQSSNEMSR